MATPTSTTSSPTYSLFLNICEQYNLSFTIVHKSQSHIIVTQPYVYPNSTILEYNTNADKIFMALDIFFKPNNNFIQYIGSCPFNESKFSQLLNDYNSKVKLIKLNLIQTKLNSIEKDF